LINVSLAICAQIYGFGRAAPQAFPAAIAGRAVDAVFSDSEPFTGGQAEDQDGQQYDGYQSFMLHG